MHPLVAMLESLTPNKRLKYLEKNSLQLETFSEAELAHVGTLLCQGSSKEMKDSNPIFGEGKKAKYD